MLQKQDIAFELVCQEYLCKTYLRNADETELEQRGYQPEDLTEHRFEGIGALLNPAHGYKKVPTCQREKSPVQSG